MLCEAFVRSMAAHIVRDCPDRYEPSVAKRRANEYDLMKNPIGEYKEQMANLTCKSSSAIHS